MISQHQRFMRNGYSLPLSQEWLFWPMGIVPSITSTVIVNGDPIDIETKNPVIENRRLARRTRMEPEHRDALMQSLVNLRAIRPQA